MAEAARLRGQPFLLAAGVSLLLVLSAPFVGQIRSELRRAFPEQFVTIIGGLVGMGVVLALGAAAVRIRARRAARYGAIAVALVIAALYSAWRAGPFPESNAVERFHFLQYGLITFLFYRAWRPLGDVSILMLPLFAGLIVGTAEEWFQWFIPNRVGEMHDIFLNLVAIATGLLFSVAVDPPGGRLGGMSPASRQRVALLAAGALGAFALFFHVVHLGHVVQDDEIGAFTSRWSRAELLDLQGEKRAQWQATPPPVTLVRLSREDQYLTEGIQHVAERNELWAAGDVRGAWLENRILETYYEPVLDTPTHAGAGHRWRAAQRADAESRSASAAGGARYVSDAYPYRIHAWSKTVFWIVIGVATLGLRVVR